MQWSEVVAPPSRKMLRQFSGLFLVVFCALAVTRVWRGGGPDTIAVVLGTLGLVVGTVGLIWPAAVRYVFTGWMIVAFPIGWTVSRVALGLVYYLVITPVALAFRLGHRDELELQRAPDRSSYWKPKAGPQSARDYLRQS